MEENWKDIKGYEGLYQVSNLGNVRGLDRKVLNGKRYVKRKGRISKQFNLGKYKYVVLYKNGKSKNLLTHRLVAEAFIPNPDNLPCVNHIVPVDDGNCINSVDNLEWCSYSKNNSYPYELGRKKPNYTNKGKFGGESGHHIEIYQVDKTTDKIIKKYSSIIEASRELNISNVSITQVCKKMPHHISAGGFKWRYVNE